MAVDWLPDGKRVVTASWDNTAKLWDAEQSTVIQTLTGISIYYFWHNLYT
jgi:WD40 repeat protein